MGRRNVYSPHLIRNCNYAQIKYNLVESSKIPHQKPANESKNVCCSQLLDLRKNVQTTTTTTIEL